MNKMLKPLLNAEIGTKIKQLREKLNLTQQVVEQKTGIDQAKLDRMETGKTKSISKN